MIKSFGDRETEKVFKGMRSKKLPGDIQQRAQRKLVQIDTAKTLEDLRLPPSNNLEALKGDLKIYHSIRINQQWRVIFIWTQSDAEEVEIIDYH